MVKEECKRYIDEVSQAVVTVEVRKKNWIDAIELLVKTPTEGDTKDMREFVDVQKRFLDDADDKFKDILNKLVECECGEFTITGNPGQSGKYKYIRTDRWDRKIFKDTLTGIYYVDVEGELHTMTQEGEPSYPIGFKIPKGNLPGKGVPYHGDLYDVIEAQVKQGKDINEVKKIVGGIWDDTTDEQIESAFRDAKVIHEHMKAKHPELMKKAK